MLTEEITVVGISDLEWSRDRSKSWWIINDDRFRKLRVWEPAVHDAILSLAASGRIEVDIREPSDPKFLPAIVAVRPSRGNAAAAHANAQPLPATAAPAAQITEEYALERFLQAVRAACDTALQTLREDIPF